MEQSIKTRNDESKKALEIKAPRVIDDALKLQGALARQLIHDNPHWSKPVAGSEVARQLC